MDIIAEYTNFEFARNGHETQDFYYLKDLARFCSVKWKQKQVWNVMDWLNFRILPPKPIWMQLQMVLIAMVWVAIPRGGAVRKYARFKNAPKMFICFLTLIWPFFLRGGLGTINLIQIWMHFWKFGDNTFPKGNFSRKGFI